jgi:hypothetical protein
LHDLGLIGFRMLQNPTPCTTRLTSFAIAVSIAVVMFLSGPGVVASQAQVPTGFVDPYSPFVTIPWFQGEVRATPIWMGIESGKNTLPGFGRSWDLRNTLNMTKSYLFLDVMARFQVGPVSLRVHGEQREMVGRTAFHNEPGRARTEPRFEFSGCRVGTDIDFFRRCGARAGINCDYLWYNPIFTESVHTDGGKKLLGDNPWTIGIHAAYTVPRQLFGAWPVFEARMRWPLKIYTSPEITDLELATGLRGPGTVLGALAVRGGYRRTSISFKDSQIYSGVPTQSNFEAVLTGWFGELVYYY